MTCHVMSYVKRPMKKHFERYDVTTMTHGHVTSSPIEVCSGFHCDSNAFELNNSINHGKITVLNISIYCL